ncbi:hypothetical protein [Neorhizobium petrolearium]|uniref:hypothetical protein n=1 Tax=Neorhizobium petrolearium TaxID=515361 RepID=UPI003F162996
MADDRRRPEPQQHLQPPPLQPELWLQRIGCLTLREMIRFYRVQGWSDAEIEIGIAGQ